MLNNHPLLPSAHSVAPHAEDLNNADMKAKEQAQARRVLQNLGTKIKQARMAKGWTRTKLARKAVVTVATIRGCEDGTKVTQPAKIKDIALALGLSARRLEADDTKDPRVKNWTDEDYEIGNWYHHAPRALKIRIWALQEVTDVGTALTDPQFVQLLEGWPRLEQAQKNFVLSSFQYIQKNPDAHDDTGGVDALAPADPKIRRPER